MVISKNKFTGRELRLLKLAMHMADSEGGWEYPEDLEWKEVENLYEKIGGIVGATSDGRHYLEWPSINDP